MLLNTATEEIGHVEMLSTAVALNLEGAPLSFQEEVSKDGVAGAALNGMNMRHILSTGLAATPENCNGVPFNASHVYASGNIAGDMYANVAAEATGRVLATRLYNMTDDPGMKDMLSFLIARDTMHQQQWLAVLEEIGPDEMTMNAPGDYQNEPESEQHAYAFFNHLADREIDPEARFASGPSLDGKGTFTAGPPTVVGTAPDLQKAPPEVHAGADSTAPGAGAGTALGRFTRGVVDKVTPG
jgi:Mn-containing catalase